MRETTTVYQPGIKQCFPKWRAFLILGMILLLFSGCADESVDDSADCQANLDKRAFQTVADNASCSNYQRGSAELGLAGFLFEDFIDDEADSNFVSVLGLTTTGCSSSGSDSLVGAYKSTYQRHLMRAQYWTRTKPEADGIARADESVEISFFSTLAEIIAETHCRIDSDLDGSISESENESFSQINIGSSSVGSSDLDASSGQYQIVSSGTVWLCDTNLPGDNCQKDPTYEGVWAKTSSTGATTYASITGSPSTITAVNRIVKVEDLQQLFDPLATAADINEPYEFLSMYTNRAGLLLEDLTALGIETDNDLYENVEDSVGEMDNGGICTNNSVQVLDLLTAIVQNAAPQSSAADLPSSNYEDYNLLQVSEISRIDTSEPTPTCPFCTSAGVTMQARLIYKTGASYTGLYKLADSDIENTLSNLATLTLDDDNELIPVVAGDEKIALKELLCME